jgi:Zn-dependent protease
MVSLAGPLSNLLLAVISAAVLKGFMTFAAGSIISNMIANIIFSCISINIVLFVFNLIPVPPLDGSKILFGILPPRHYFKMMQYERMIQLIIILLLFLGILPKFLNPIISTIIKMLMLIFGLS